MFYLMNEDISDGMIEDNAKIWCMFCDTKLSKALDDVIKQTEEKAAEDLEARSSDDSKLDEGVVRATVKTAAKTAARKAAKKTASKTAAKAATKKTAKASSKAAAKTTAKAAAKTVSTGKKIVKGAVKAGDAAVKTAQAAGTGAIAYGGYSIYDKMYGDGNADAVKVEQDGKIDLPSWQEASLKDQRAAVSAGKVNLDDLPAFERWKYKFEAPRQDKGWPAENIALAVAATWGLWKARDYIWSRVKEVVDWLQSGKSLATCVFKSDGDDYKAAFDIKTKKWKLYYAGSTVTRESSYPPNNVADKFFSTKFFSKLTKACWQNASKYLNDKAFAAVSAAVCNDKKIDSNAKDVLKDVFKSRKEILQNLKDGKYAYI